MDLCEIWKNNNFVISGATAQKYNTECFNTKLPLRYIADEYILSTQIPLLIHENSSRNEIYHAVTLINSFYSTRMGADDCWRLSYVLEKFHQKIWTAIHATDIAVVDVVQDVIDAQRTVQSQDSNKVRVAFSFTTKYFSILNRYIGGTDVYPIYDALVAKVLDYYFWRQNNSKYGKRHVSSCNKTIAKDYRRYYEIISKIYGNKDYKFLDNYLWDFGRRLSSTLPNQAWACIDMVDMTNAIKSVMDEINKVA